MVYSCSTASLNFAIYGRIPDACRQDYGLLLVRDGLEETLRGNCICGHPRGLQSHIPKRPLSMRILLSGKAPGGTKLDRSLYMLVPQ